MTAREALIQAMIELGISRELAELKTKMSDAALPDAVASMNGQVRPGLERDYIEFLKQLFRKIDASPSAKAWIVNEVRKRAQPN